MTVTLIHTHMDAPARTHALSRSIIVSAAHGGTLWKLLGRSY